MAVLSDSVRLAFPTTVLASSELHRVYGARCRVFSKVMRRNCRPQLCRSKRRFSCSCSQWLQQPRIYRQGSDKVSIFFSKSELFSHEKFSRVLSSKHDSPYLSSQADGQSTDERLVSAMEPGIRNDHNSICETEANVEEGSKGCLSIQTIDDHEQSLEMVVLKDGNSQNGHTNMLTNFLGSVVRTLSGAGTLKISSSESAVQLPPTKEDSKSLILWNPLRLLDGTTPSPVKPFREKLSKGWRQAEADFFAFSRQLGKYVVIMTGTGAILATGFQLSGGGAQEDALLWFSWLAGVVLGSMIGAGQVLESHAKGGRRNVVITGSTRGLGKALAREFLRHGDNVIVTSRSINSVEGTVEELRNELRLHSRNFFESSDPDLEVYGLSRAERLKSRVVGKHCDVSKTEDVIALSAFAKEEFGNIDLWINNAGVNKGFRPLMEFTDEELDQIVSTNLTGSMICTREAIRLMQSQPRGGHVFNMDGAGSGGSSTPLTAAYGATKCGLRQLHASLLKECKGSRVGIHTASPGMVLTDLLLSGASLQNKKMFNLICEQPETVARALVPSLRVVKGTGKAVNYLTPPRIILAIVTAWLRRGRWFDEEGRAVYAAEADRLRMWAEGRERSTVTAAMELVPSGTWVSLFSSSVICAYVILSSSSGNMPGT